MSFPNGLYMDSMEYSADSLQIVQQPLPRDAETALADQGWGRGAQGLSSTGLSLPGAAKSLHRVSRGRQQSGMWLALAGKRDMGEADIEDFASVPWWLDVDLFVRRAIPGSANAVTSWRLCFGISHCFLHNASPQILMHLSKADVFPCLQPLCLGFSVLGSFPRGSF